MQIICGTDIVNIKEFEEMLNMSEKNFKKRCFTQEELKQNPKIHNLVGIFAAKEAIIKAFSLAAGSWLQIQIIKNAQGKPITTLPKEVNSCDISISHTTEYAIALFTALIR